MTPNIKRVLMTADTIGGVWVFAIELIRELEKKNIEVVLAAMGNALSSDQFQQVNKLSNVLLEQSTFKLEWMEDPWTDIEHAGNWLLNIEKKHSPDIIHLNEYSFASLPWAAPVILTAHSCVYSWFSEVKGVLPDNHWNTYKEKVREALRDAEYVIAPTKTMLDYLNRFYGSIQQKKVIYNGRNAKNFKPSVKQPFIFSAGRLWDEAKNIQTLAQVAPSLRWPVYVAGDYKNPDKDEIHFDNVNWLGLVSEKKMAEMFSHASIYALPAKYEPFGLSVLEAGMSGCALVLGSIDSLLEIWDGAALFVDPDDPEELSAAINDLITDEDFRNKIADLSLKRAGKYTSGRMVSEYLNIYQHLKQLKTPIIQG